MTFLTALDQDVEIVIKTKPRSQGGRIVVRANVRDSPTRYLIYWLA
jgi:hypothetical protein